MTISSVFSAAKTCVEGLQHNRPPVLAVRANDIAFLGLLRGIHAAGFEAISLVYTWPGAGPWYCEESVHFKNTFEIANPLTDEAEAVSRLTILGKALLARYGQPSLVLPSSDSVQLLFLRHEVELAPYFSMMGAPDYTSYRADVTNKGSFFEQLSSQYPEVCPKTFWCRSTDELENFVSEVTYPAIIKPAIKDYQQKFYRLNNGSKAISIDTETQLRSEIDRLLIEGFELVVQEKIAFDGAKDEIPFYAYVDKHQNIRIGATGIKEFIQPHPYGTATVLRLTSHPELASLAQKVAQAIGWTGTLMIEFIKDQKDGLWKVIEVNTRPWLFHDFYRRSGLAFVPYAIKEHAGLLDPVTTNPSPILPDQNQVNELGLLHLDLPTIARDLCDAGRSSSENIALLQNHVAKYSSTFSLAHGAPDDWAPAEKMLADLSRTYSLDLSALKDAFGISTHADASLIQS